jgi:hypothetical protein
MANINIESPVDAFVTEIIKASHVDAGAQLLKLHSPHLDT